MGVNPLPNVLVHLTGNLPRKQMGYVGVTNVLAIVEMLCGLQTG